MPFTESQSSGTAIEATPRTTRQVTTLTAIRMALAAKARTSPLLADLQPGSVTQRAAEAYLQAYSEAPYGCQPHLVAKNAAETALEGHNPHAIDRGVEKARQAIQDSFGLIEPIMPVTSS